MPPTRAREAAGARTPAAGAPGRRPGSACTLTPVVLEIAFLVPRRHVERRASSRSWSPSPRAPSSAGARRARPTAPSRSGASGFDGVRGSVRSLPSSGISAAGRRPTRRGPPRVARRAAAAVPTAVDARLERPARRRASGAAAWRQIGLGRLPVLQRRQPLRADESDEDVAEDRAEVRVVPAAVTMKMSGRGDQRACSREPASGAFRRASMDHLQLRRPARRRVETVRRNASVTRAAAVDGRPDVEAPPITADAAEAPPVRAILNSSASRAISGRGTPPPRRCAARLDGHAASLDGRRPQLPTSSAVDRLVASVQPDRRRRLVGGFRRASFMRRLAEEMRSFRLRRRRSLQVSWTSRRLHPCRRRCGAVVDPSSIAALVEIGASRRRASRPSQRLDATSAPRSDHVEKAHSPGRRRRRFEKQLDDLVVVAAAANHLVHARPRFGDRHPAGARRRVDLGVRAEALGVLWTLSAAAAGQEAVTADAPRAALVAALAAATRSVSPARRTRARAPPSSRRSSAAAQPGGRAEAAFALAAAGAVRAAARGRRAAGGGSPAVGDALLVVGVSSRAPRRARIRCSRREPRPRCRLSSARREPAIRRFRLAATRRLARPRAASFVSEAVDGADPASRASSPRRGVGDAIAAACAAARSAARRRAPLAPRPRRAARWRRSLRLLVPPLAVARKRRRRSSRRARRRSRRGDGAPPPRVGRRKGLEWLLTSQRAALDGVGSDADVRSFGAASLASSRSSQRARRRRRRRRRAPRRRAAPSTRSDGLLSARRRARRHGSGSVPRRRRRRRRAISSRRVRRGPCSPARTARDASRPQHRRAVAAPRRGASASIRASNADRNRPAASDRVGRRAAELAARRGSTAAAAPPPRGAAVVALSAHGRGRLIDRPTIGARRASRAAPTRCARLVADATAVAAGLARCSLCRTSSRARAPPPRADGARLARRRCAPPPPRVRAFVEARCARLRRSATCARAAPTATRSRVLEPDAEARLGGARLRHVGRRSSAARAAVVAARCAYDGRALDCPRGAAASPSSADAVAVGGARAARVRASPARAALRRRPPARPSAARCALARLDLRERHLGAAAPPPAAHDVPDKGRAHEEVDEERDDREAARAGRRPPPPRRRTRARRASCATKTVRRSAITEKRRRRRAAPPARRAAAARALVLGDQRDEVRHRVTHRRRRCERSRAIGERRADHLRRREELVAQPAASLQRPQRSSQRMRAEERVHGVLRAQDAREHFRATRAVGERRAASVLRFCSSSSWPRTRDARGASARRDGARALTARDQCSRASVAVATLLWTMAPAGAPLHNPVAADEAAPLPPNATLRASAARRLRKAKAQVEADATASSRR